MTLSRTSAPSILSRGDDSFRPVLLRGARAVLSMDPAVGVLVDGDVLIVGDRIAAVGRGLAGPAGTVEIDARRFLVTPGFVDGHRHCWQGALRRLVTEADLPRYMAVTHDGVARHYTPDDMYAGDLVALLGAIDHGFTSVLDLSHNSRSAAHSDAVFQAYRDSGIRAVHASAPPNAYDWDEQWPDDLSRLRAVADGENLSTLRMAIDMRRVKPIEKLIAIARDLGIGIHIDGAMGAATSDELVRLGRDGILGPDITVVHATSLADEAWEHMAGAGVRIVLATTSDEQLGLAGAIPPVQKVMDHGLLPGLSVDVEISLAGDPFTQMRSTLLTQRMLAAADAIVGGAKRRMLTSAEVLEWATVGGAQASGLGEVAGMISPGMAADLLLVSVDDIAVAPLGGNYLGTMVHGVDRSNIWGVLIDGKVRKWEGALVDVDVAAAVAHAEESRRGLLGRAGFGLDETGISGVPELQDEKLRHYLDSHNDEVAALR